MKKPKKKLKVFNLFIIVFAVVFLFSTGMFIKDILTYQKEEKAFDDLVQKVTVIQDEQESKFLDLLPLKEENEDLWGWIKIEGTNVNYPVMWTPDNVEYYLCRDFEKKKSNAGTPFLGYDTAMDNQHLIIYAHHMHNGTMFADLLKYSDKDYWQQHRIIQLQTMDMYYEYEILAAFESKAYTPEDVGVFRYYNYTDLSDEATFEEYMSQVYESSAIDTGVPTTVDDDILTLSTCRYDEKEGRYVVVARRVHEEKIGQK